ncbi:MAG: hypothetical protein A3E01_02705 [Gammaproteobacteria bacterium RIFCSPHIGHO2_12_FULL_63_22]|nr:MAG: hypothetical protein A3E01_02705 [Gammaproteobacteria bacterium RIFCSPHIGHO2_12_FULL_63_22]
MAGTTFSVDVLIAEIACERVELKHGATDENMDWITAAFFADLASAYQEIGIVNCTPWMASQLRDAVRDRYLELKKKHDHDAEIAWWYKIDPFGLTTEQKIGLLANLERQKARQIIFEGDVPDDAGKAYRLGRLAYDEERAQQMATEAIRKKHEQLIREHGHATPA